MSAPFPSSQWYRARVFVRNETVRRVNSARYRAEPEMRTSSIVPTKFSPITNGEVMARSGSSVCLTPTSLPSTNRRYSLPSVRRLDAADGRETRFPP